jgi:hypothetical protein
MGLLVGSPDRRLCAAIVFAPKPWQTHLLRLRRAASPALLWGEEERNKPPG